MELLDLRYDAAFKEFFKDTELLSSFISSITGKELTVESLEYTEEKAVSKIYQISEIDDIQLKVIEEALEESKRLDWEDDVLEKAENMVKEAVNKAKEAAREEAREAAKKEKIEIVKNLLDILDNETISQKTGLSIDEINHLR